MKRLIFIGVFLFSFTSFLPLNAQWARTYGGSGNDNAWFIQQTNDGGYIVAGEAQLFDAVWQHFWILKLSSDGEVEWQRAYGGNYWDRATSIQQTSDGGYIVAGNTYSFGAGKSDFWVLRLSSDGGIEWQHAYGGSEFDDAHSIQQTSDGGYIVAGETYSFGAGKKDFWVLKLSSDGDIEWQHAYGGSEFDCAHSIQQTSDGGYIVAGHTMSFGAGSADVWVLKLNSTGEIEWKHSYGGGESDAAYSIHQTNDGGYIVAGHTISFGAGNLDIWVLKLSSDGEIEWQHTYGGTDFEQAHSIKQASDGGYIVAGYARSFSAGSYYSLWVLKLSSDGEIEWQHTYGESSPVYASCSIQQTSDGGYIVGGNTYSFGAGSADFFVLKLYSDGDIDSSCGFIGSSNASTINTYISPQDSYIAAQFTNVIPLATSVMPQDTYVIANLVCEAPKYTLKISATTGGTTDPAPDTYEYYKNLEVQIEAIPNSGYELTGWSGDASGTTNPIAITMDSDKSITANFSTIPSGDTGDGDGGGKKGGCFIATAAYGSQLHPHLDILRDFRDRYLMPKKFGRMLVSFYYKYSPFVADLIANNKVLKVIVQINLLPFVVFSYSLLHFGSVITAIMLAFIFMFPIFLISFFRRKIRQR